MRLSEVTAEDIGSCALVKFWDDDHELVEIVDVHAHDAVLLDPESLHDSCDETAKRLYAEPHNQVTVRFVDSNVAMRLYATPEYEIVED